MSARSSPERRPRRLLSSPTAAATAIIRPEEPAAIGPAASLPNDIVIFEIFSRLPVKSVCRFRCASRRWHKLISGSRFAAAHGSHRPEPLFVVVDPFRGLRLIDMDGKVVTVVKDVSCSRLLSTSMDDLVCVTKDRHDFAQVIDPVTGNVLLDWQCGKSTYCHLVFGFGRAVPSGAHKLVRIFDMDCKVITLGDDITWRSARSPPIYVAQTQSAPVVVNGIMYALVSRSNGELLCFDLETEEWKKTLEGPHEAVDSGTDMWEKTMLVRLTELDSALSMVQSEFSTTNIWLLSDYHKDSWVKMYTIPIAFYANPMPLRMTRDGDTLVFCCTLGKQEKVVQVYDPRNKACTALLRLGVHDIKIGLCSLHLDRFVSAKF